MTTEQQMKYFREGFPWMKIEAPATPGNGIEVLDTAAQDACIAYSEVAKVAGRVKFVPASCLVGDAALDGGSCPPPEPLPACSRTFLRGWKSRTIPYAD